MFDFCRDILLIYHEPRAREIGPLPVYLTLNKSSHLISSCLALPCLALPCLALPCLALPCLALPCLALPCLAFPCLALPCLALVKGNSSPYKNDGVLVGNFEKNKLTPKVLESRLVGVAQINFHP